MTNTHLFQGATGWLLWANVVIWVGMAAYLLFLARSQAALGKRVKRLETELPEQGLPGVRHDG